MYCRNDTCILYCKVQYGAGRCSNFTFVPSSSQGLTSRRTTRAKLPKHHERRRPTALIIQCSSCRYLTCLSSQTLLFKFSLQPDFQNSLSCGGWLIPQYCTAQYGACSVNNLTVFSLLFTSMMCLCLLLS